MKCYVVNAFTDTVFKGNPAAVCILEKWLPDALMQDIAMENNLSETAFIVRNGEVYDLRWFTLGGEIDLCGHATLATAYVLMRFVVPNWNAVSFQTKSGLLKVQKKQDLYEMNMPAYQLTSVPVTSEMEQTIGFLPVEAWMGRDLICVLEDEEQVIQATPDEENLKNGRATFAAHCQGQKIRLRNKKFCPKAECVGRSCLWLWPLSCDTFMG